MLILILPIGCVQANVQIKRSRYSNLHPIMFVIHKSNFLLSVQNHSSISWEDDFARVLPVFTIVTFQFNRLMASIASITLVRCPSVIIQDLNPVLSAPWRICRVTPILVTDFLCASFGTTCVWLLYADIDYIFFNKKKYSISSYSSVLIISSSASITWGGGKIWLT